MTREAARKNLVAIGIAEPTDEQITNYLNQVQGETKFERERADKLKDDASKAAELQKQLDEINSQNLSDLEKANKDRDAALNSVNELKKQLQQMQTMASLAEQGITGDNAKNLIKEDGTIDFATLGKIISERETKAAADKEAELLNKTPNPGGSKGSDDDGKTDAERLVDQLLPTNDGGSNNKSVISNYINGGN